MIKINEEEIEWREGMTVRDAMNDVKYTFPMVIVSVNDKPVAKKDLETYLVNDGDFIRVFHLESGG